MLMAFSISLKDASAAVLQAPSESGSLANPIIAMGSGWDHVDVADLVMSAKVGNGMTLAIVRVDTVGAYGFEKLVTFFDGHSPVGWNEKVGFSFDMYSETSAVRDVYLE